LDAYSQAIRIDPKNVGALNNRCYVDIMINDYDAAIRDCGEAVRLDPNHINSYLGLGNAYALLAAKQQKAPTLVSTGGAFAGYLVLFAAMIPYDIVGDFLHPYWTIRGQISLHDRDGKEIHQQALFKQITHRTHPEMHFFEDPTFVIGLPEAEKDFPDVVLEIPNWGVGVLSIRSHKNTRDEFRKIIQLQTPLIINENAHYVSSDSRPQ
jgi:tetratricopeptide (TPR) repeat protein